MVKYSSLARDVIHVLEKSDDRLVLYKFINKLIKYTKESPYCDFAIPIVELSEEDKCEPKYLTEYNKANIGFRFTENCIISNKCSKECYRYNICKKEYEKGETNE